MQKLYYTINKDSTGNLCHKIFYSSTKTSAKNHLRDEGLIPKLVLTWSDVEKVIEGTLQQKDLTEKIQEYVVIHYQEWKDSR